MCLLWLVVPYLQGKNSNKRLKIRGKSYLPLVCIISQIQFVTTRYTLEKHFLFVLIIFFLKKKDSVH